MYVDKIVDYWSLYLSRVSRPHGLEAWFHLRVVEVPGSIPGADPFRYFSTIFNTSVSFWVTVFFKDFLHPLSHLTLLVLSLLTLSQTLFYISPHISPTTNCNPLRSRWANPQPRTRKKIRCLRPRLPRSKWAWASW